MDIITKAKRVFLSLIFICFSLISFRPFIVNQIAVRGDGYFGYNMYKDAIREYKKALVLDPDNSNVMNWLGYTYKYMGNIDKAISIYKKAIKIDPQNIIAHHDLGMIYALNKKFKLAKEHFLKASSIPLDNEKYTDKDYIFYHRASLEMLSLCQEKLGEINEAIKTNEKILEYYPNHKLAGERIIRLKNLKR